MGNKHNYTESTVTPPCAGDAAAISGTGAKFESYGSPYEDEPAAPAASVTGYSRVDASTLAGKVVCGYQAWFNTPGSGIEFDRWFHWAGSTPAKDNITFEIYPDTREYPEDALYKTNLGALGCGKEAKLYSGNIASVIDTHFRWMARYGIDGVALQRFVTDARNPKIYGKMAQVIENVGASSEKYGRIFYLCYDISGAPDKGFFDTLKADFDSIREKLLSFSSYLYHGGKPVIQVWGLGVGGNCRVSAAEGVRTVKYLLDLGFYVIGGTPTHWFTETRDALKGYREVYNLYHMISPWQVGRFGGSDVAGEYTIERVQTDLQYCENLGGKDYMPVIFSGFAWSNWNGGKRNHIPRESGRFIWEQARAIARTKCTSVYLAMFDEYDEATAIAKGAEDSSMTPTDQYFLTYAADGNWLSSDYYLRLTGRITELFRSGTSYESYPAQPDIPFSAGPVYMRTSFERDTDPVANVRQIHNTCGASLELTDEAALSGTMSYKLTTSGAGECEFMLLGLPGSADGSGYKISRGMRVRFFAYSNTAEGLRVSLEIYTASGRRLSQTDAAELPAVDTSQTYGKPGEWSRFTVNIGRYLEGETITGISLRLATNSVQTVYIDNILVCDG